MSNMTHTDRHRSTPTHPDRCPVCGCTLLAQAFPSGTHVRWCRWRCYGRIENRDGGTVQECTRRLPVTNAPPALDVEAGMRAAG